MKKILLCIFVSAQFVLNAQPLPSISEKTKGMIKHGGFIPFYWDENSGKLWFEITGTEKEILYVMSLPAGLGSNDVGLDRGLLGGERIVKFNRVGRKLLLVEPNYNFRAITNNNAEQKAVEQSFAQSVLWGFVIEAASDGHVLVDATEFLMRDGMKTINLLSRQGQGNYNVDKTRSALYLPMTKNFPENTELEATITLVNNDGKTGSSLNGVVPSAEAISLRTHHSFLQLPDDNFRVRTFNPRSGYYPVSFFDYSTPVGEPIEKFLAVRHRLQKKNPGAEKSEAIKPIIYYVDNGIPEPIRTALVEGASWWNQAFEAAGFINAFQVKLLPETADPMDVRYNVINWVHRSTRGWSYGASVTDPRTGEIIKGHVSLGSLRVRQDYLIAQGLLAPYENGQPSDDKMLKMALNRLKQLAAHEVGHTLGLMHNYAASVVNRNSVMDYPPPSVKLDLDGNIDISNAYATGIGEWDKVAINWGYRQFDETSNEAVLLNNILTTSFRNGFQFISDRDARDAGGMHPRAHLWDDGNDPVTALQVAMKVRAKALQHFGTNNIKEGTAMALLEDVLVPVYLYHRYQVEAVVKIVGGMDYTYATKGDGQLVTKAVPMQMQQQALDALVSTLHPSALVLPQHILQLIPPRPAGYSYNRELFKRRTGLSLDVLSPAETAADLPLSFLFNSARLNRLAQAGHTEMNLEKVLTSLINATWKTNRLNDAEALIQMQTEQMLLSYLLAESVNDKNTAITQAILLQTLNDLKTFIEFKQRANTGGIYSGHLILALEKIAHPENAKPAKHIEAPPGSPIGCSE